MQVLLRNQFPTELLERSLKLSVKAVDRLTMATDPNTKPAARCAYIRACYLAEDLKCFGYKTDCPLYQKSNGQYFNEARFHEAMDKLIDKTRARFANLPK